METDNNWVYIAVKFQRAPKVFFFFKVSKRFIIGAYFSNEPDEVRVIQISILFAQKNTR